MPNQTLFYSDLFNQVSKHRVHIFKEMDLLSVWIHLVISGCLFYSLICGCGLGVIEQNLPELLIQLKQKCHVKPPFAVTACHCQEIAFWKGVLKFNLHLIELNTHIWKEGKRKSYLIAKLLKKKMSGPLEEKNLNFNLFQGHSVDIFFVVVKKGYTFLFCQPFNCFH